MTGALFPLSFASEEARLLTGIVIGFLFGFVLERGGFGNARKLAAQFYLNDMTVFKVMFTAILVAMVGLFGLSALGLADLSLMWINPTFIPAQAVGGFLLGVGFIMSGLCPGTAVVSMVSGRIDAWVAFLGIVLGIALFALTVDWLPGLGALYAAGSGEVSLLHEVFGVPALALVVGIVAVATLAFVGAEVVEGIVQGKRPPVELTPPTRPRLKLAVGGSLAVVALLALAVSGPRPEMPPVQAASLAPLALAQSIIEREPGILVLDLRANPEGEKGIPGAAVVWGEEEAVELLGVTPPGTVVVVYDESGSLTEVPRGWPGTLDYRFLEGGWEGWRREVLTPAALWGNTLEERDWVRKQNQIAAFFSGAAVHAAPVAAPPPAMSSGGTAPQRRAGGC